jgi:phosphatidylserine/phosphatidylglycerophosphate/cardiolipin synthase-like enzyme
VTITNLQPGRIYYFNVSSTSSGGTTTSPQLYFCTASGSTGQINVYFNRSVDTTLHSGEPANGFVNFQTRLKQRIDNAQHSIDMCLYSLNDLTQIRDALINAKIRGVKIRFVYDSRTNQALVNDLIAAGIPIIKRPPSTELMHNKFFIFDYRYNNNPNNCWVWTGSTNITNDQFFNDANNVIEIQDRTLCAIYTREFEEMWGSATDVPIPSRAKFGPSKSDNVPHILNINGKRIEVYFSPGDNPSVQIENTIATQTDQSLYFAIYSFTRCNIHNRMKSKFDAGKDVRGVFDDAENTNPSSVYKTMKGLTGGACPPPWSPPGDVWLDNASGMLHHKYIIIDSYTPSSNPVTITGSFNFSNSATFDNDENFLIVYDSRVANLYLQEFAMRYRTAGGSNPIGIIQIADELPRMYNLYQNYPNPFNPETSIEFDIPEQAFVILSVYDVTGREIEVLLRENLSAGRYQVRWNAVDYPSGVYYYRLITDGFSKSGKMILIK